MPVVYLPTWANEKNWKPSWKVQAPNKTTRGRSSYGGLGMTILSNDFQLQKLHTPNCIFGSRFLFEKEFDS
jgi:hypothetical protein